jgi:hypothetical protein
VAEPLPAGSYGAECARLEAELARLKQQIVQAFPWPLRPLARLTLRVVLSIGAVLGGAR